MANNRQSSWVDQKSLNIFLKELKRYRVLTPEEERELASKCKAGDKKAKEKLLRHNLRFVVDLAKRYTNQGVPLSELINEGAISLLKAIELFDETLGFKLISYAVEGIKRDLIQYVNKSRRNVRFPNNRAKDSLHVLKCEALLKQKLGREPSTEEILREAGMEEHDLIIARSLQGWEEYAEQSSAEHPKELFTSEDEDTYRTSDLSYMIRMARKKLSREEEDVIRHYYGLDGEVPLCSTRLVAQRLNMSEYGVAKRKKTALRNLRELIPESSRELL